MNHPMKGDHFRKMGAHFESLKVMAQDMPDFTVKITEGFIEFNETEYIGFPGGNSPELQPPSAGTAKWVFVGIDKDRNVVVVNGDEDAASPMPPVMAPDQYPLAAIFMQADATAVTNDMINDLRPVFRKGTARHPHDILLGTDAPDLHPILSITGLQAELDDRPRHADLTAFQDTTSIDLANKADIDGTPATRFVLNKDATGVPTIDVSMEVERGAQPNAAIKWNENIDKWQFTNDGATWFDFSDAGGYFDASSTNSGVVKLSIDPVSDAIAVGDNDPRILQQAQKDALLAHMSDTNDPHGIIDNHTHDEFYTETEINDMMATKAEALHNHFVDHYTKAEMDTSLAGKSDTSHTHLADHYTKAEMDTSLAGKSDVGHNHDAAYYLKAEVDSALSNKANSVHNHDNAYYSKTELDSFLSGKSDTAHVHDSRYYQKSEIDTQMSSKSDVSHNHDAAYYTQAAVDALLADKAEASHNHDAAYYHKPEVDTLLAGKADAGHNHNVDYYQKPEVDTFLAGKAELVHDHDDRYFTEAESDARFSQIGHDHDNEYYTETELDGMFATKAEVGHDHNDVYYTETEMDTALAGKADAGHNHDDMYYTESEMDTALAGKSNTGHDHDDMYYTEAEMDTALAGKADAAHDHDDSYYTEAEMDTALAGKADATHDHLADHYTKAESDGLITDHETTHDHSKLHDANTDMYLNTEVTQTRFIDGNRTDTYTADGSSTKPFKTVGDALTAITDASAAKPYTLFVMPGIYSEDITFKPFISMFGFSRGVTQIFGGGSHSGTFAADTRIDLKNIDFGNQSMVFTHSPTSPGSCLIRMDNIVTGDVVCNMLGGGVDNIELRNDTYLHGKLNVHSAGVSALNSTFMDGLEIDDQGVEHVDGAGRASTSTIKDCMGNDLLCQGSTRVDFFNNYSWSALTVDGAGCTIAYDTQSAPDSRANLISMNGGTFIRTDNAWAAGFDNTTSGMTADNVQDAMDEMKAEMPVDESGPTASRPATPVVGQRFFDTDLGLPIHFDGTNWIKADGTIV